MMKKIIYTLAFAVASVALFSCSEEEDHHEPNSAVISITEPLTNTHIHHNDTLKIRGSIVSVADLHGYEISIKRTVDQSEVFYFEDHYHGTNKNLQVDWICDLNETSDLELTITASLDHDGNTATKSLIIHCQQ